MLVPVFEGLGKALRWLREKQGKRQYQVAQIAGITKAMLSAYETGKQKPSLDTLEKVLAALGADLADLAYALDFVNERPVEVHRNARGKDATPTADGTVDIYSALDLRQSVSPKVEAALNEMLQGFHRLLRYLVVTADEATGAQGSGPNEP